MNTEYLVFTGAKDSGTLPCYVGIYYIIYGNPPHGYPGLKATYSSVVLSLVIWKESLCTWYSGQDQSASCKTREYDLIQCSLCIHGGLLLHTQNSAGIKWDYLEYLRGNECEVNEITI